MKWKLLRWILPRLAVVVDVTSQQKAVGPLLRLVRLVKGKDIDVMIFPEGARYPDDRVHPFYGGFVALAKLLKRPVVPVAIVGVNKVYPPSTFWVYRHPVTVIVGKPMRLQEEETDAAFKERVRQWFVEQVES
jgi:1-acyl-sn-glycerol-3-phosphate acyltransferase